MNLIQTFVVALVALVSRAPAWGSNMESRETRHSRPGGYGPPRCHDHSFVPDHVLRITYEDISIACQTRPSVVVNGSLSGPELRLKPGKTSWIRVYNDMTEFNATIVGETPSILMSRLFANGVVNTALAWAQPTQCYILRWHSICKPVADSSTSLLRL